jgi:hypothetical protein
MKGGRRGRAKSLEDVGTKTRRKRVDEFVVHLFNLGGGDDALYSNVKVALKDYPGALAHAATHNDDALKVGRCRLTVSKLALKAPMGSALETKM